MTQLENPSKEHLVVVIWALVCHMSPVELERACDSLQGLPVAEHIPTLLRELRAFAAT